MGDSAITPVHIAIIAGGFVIIFAVLVGFVCASHRAVVKHEDGQAAALREELTNDDINPPQVAIQMHATGYLMCPSCAFENFKYTKQCVMCRTKLVVPPRRAPPALPKI